MGFTRRLRVAWFTGFGNTFTVVDDFGVVAFASAFSGVGGEAVVAFEVAWVRSAVTFGCWGGDCVRWVVAFLLMRVGVNLSNEVLFDSCETVDPRGLPDEEVLLDEEVNRGNTDTSVNVAEDVSPDFEIQVETDTNISSRTFYEMLVEGRAQH